MANPRRARGRHDDPAPAPGPEVPGPPPGGDDPPRRRLLAEAFAALFAFTAVVLAVLCFAVGTAVETTAYLAAAALLFAVLAVWTAAERRQVRRRAARRDREPGRSRWT